MTRTLELQPGRLTLDDLQAIHAGGVRLALAPESRDAIRASATIVQRAALGAEPVYGVNTGFGKLASTRIEPARLRALQMNLIRSHSVGVGEPLRPAVVRLMLALKAASLARGYSGVRELVVDALLAVHNAGLVPYVPAQGSVGASGDLAPLAHMTLALTGEGEMLSEGRRVPAAPALAAAGIEPLSLEAKEGLALINGTQVSTALALHALLEFEPALEAALVIGAMTVDAARGSDGPFDPRIHALRGQPGQIDVAQYYRALLSGSEIRRSHLEGDDRVQDPYSLRCQPQVVGACLDQLRHAALVLLCEASAVTDNPLVFAGEGEGEIISGGNFHAEPVALAADAMAVAIAEVGEDERVVGHRVGFAHEHEGGVAQLVEARADDLRLAAQAVRILDAVVAFEMRAPDRAPGEQRAVVAGDVDLPQLAAQRVDARIKRAVAAAGRVDGHRADHERRFEHRLERQQRVERERGRDLRAVDEREPFLGGERERRDASGAQHVGRGTTDAVDDELALADQRQREMRERRQVA